MSFPSREHPTQGKHASQNHKPPQFTPTTSTRHSKKPSKLTASTKLASRSKAKLTPPLPIHPQPRTSHTLQPTTTTAQTQPQKNSKRRKGAKAKGKTGRAGTSDDKRRLGIGNRSPRTTTSRQAQGTTKTTGEQPKHHHPITNTPLPPSKPNQQGSFLQ